MKDNRFDLEERTAVFAENIIRYCQAIPRTAITVPLITQLVRSGTSIGANYSEANGASSKRDFKNKIFICKKEAKETMYWLRIIENTIENLPGESSSLKAESQELTYIFAKIAFNTKL